MVNNRPIISMIVSGPTNERHTKCAQYPIIYERLVFYDPHDVDHDHSGLLELEEVLIQAFTAAQMKQMVEDLTFMALAEAFRTWDIDFLPIMHPNAKPPGHEYPDATATILGETFDVEITRVSPMDASGTNVETYTSLMNAGRVEASQLSPVLYCHHQRYQDRHSRCPRRQFISESQFDLGKCHDSSHRHFVILPPRTAYQAYPRLVADIGRWDLPMIVLPNFEINELNFANRVLEALTDKRADVKNRCTDNKSCLVVVTQSFVPIPEWISRLDRNCSEGLDAIVLVNLSGYIGMVHNMRAAKVAKTFMFKCAWCHPQRYIHDPIETVIQEFGGDEQGMASLSSLQSQDDAMTAMLRTEI